MSSVSSLTGSFSAPAAKPHTDQRLKDANSERCMRIQKLVVQIPSGDSKSGAQGEVRCSVTGNRSPVVVKSFFDPFIFETESERLERVRGVPHTACFRAKGILGNQAVVILDNAGKDDLFDFINNNGKLSEEKALLLAHQMLECLQSLKKKGIIHRDIKPDNVIVRSHVDGELQFTLVDFGLAIENSQNQERCEVGTSAYASPEYALSIKSSPHQDIWGLGYLLFVVISEEPLLYNFEYETNRQLGLLQEMQGVFGEFPQSMIKAAPINVKKSCFNKKRRLLKPWKSRYVLKKANFKCASLEDRMKEFPESIKKLLRRIFSYENRPTVEELLNLEDMKKDVCFKIEVPPSPKVAKLLIASEINISGETKTVVKKFDLREKSFNKTYHHIPKSKNGKYKIALMDKSEVTLDQCETEFKNLQESIESLLSKLAKNNISETEHVNLTINSENFAENFKGLELIIESNTSQGKIKTIFRIKESKTFQVPISKDNKYKITFKYDSGQYIESGEVIILPGKSYSLE